MYQHTVYTRIQEQAKFIGINSLFETLILHPEILLKRSVVVIVCGKVFWGSVMYNNKSSAYNDNLCSFPPLKMPWMLDEKRSDDARGLIVTGNNRREIGHLCFVPRCNRKLGVHIISAYWRLSNSYTLKRPPQPLGCYGNRPDHTVWEK